MSNQRELLDTDDVVERQKLEAWFASLTTQEQKELHQLQAPALSVPASAALAYAPNPVPGWCVDWITRFVPEALQASAIMAFGTRDQAG